MKRYTPEQINYAEQWGDLYPDNPEVQEVVQKAKYQKFLVERQRELESEQFRAANPVETSTMENTGLGLFGLGMAASAFPPTAPLGAGLTAAGMLSELTGNPLSQLYQSYRGLTPRETSPQQELFNKAMVLGLPIAGAISPALGAAAGIGLGGYGLYEKGQGPGTFGENLTEAMITQPVPTAVDVMALSHGAGKAGEAMGRNFLPGIIRSMEPTPGAAQEAVPMDVKRSMGIFRYLPEAVMPPEVTKAKGLYDVGVDFSAPQKFIGDEAVAKAAEAKITGEYGVNIADQIKGASSEIWLNEGQIKKAWSESKPINIMNPAKEGEPATVAFRIDPKEYKTLDEFRRFFVQHEYNHNMGILDELQASTTPRTQAEMDATQKFVKKLIDVPEHVKKMVFESPEPEQVFNPLSFMQEQTGRSAPQPAPFEDMPMAGDISALNQEAMSPLPQSGGFGADFIRDLRAARLNQTVGGRDMPSGIKPRPEPVPTADQFRPIRESPIIDEGALPLDEKFVDPFEAKSDVYNDETGNLVVRGRDTSEPSRFFAKGKTEEEPGFLGKILSLPGTWKQKLKQGGKEISDWAQRLVGKQSENMLIGLEKHARGLGIKVIDGKLPMEHVNDLKKEMWKGIYNEAQLKKEFGKIIDLAAQVDMQAEPDFTTDGGLWLRGLKPAKTPQGLALQREILSATKRLGKEEYRYTGEGDYARQMLLTKDMDTLVLDALNGLAPKAQKGFIAMFKPESKLSPIEKAFRDEYLEDVRGDPARENQLLKVKEYFNTMNNRAITALSDPRIITNDPNAQEFAGMSESQLKGRLKHQTGELIKSIWLKQMEPGERLDLESEFKPGIAQKRSFFFHPEYLEKDGRKLLESWMSQHQMLQKAPVYNKITEMLTKGVGKGMPQAREILKNIQHETNAQIIRGKPTWLSQTADKYFGWQTSDAINPGTEVIMKAMQTMYQQFLGTPRFGLLNSSDAFLKSAMLLAEKGNGLEDMAAIGKIVGKAIIGDKTMNKIINDFFVSGEPASYELKRVFDLPAKGDTGKIPQALQNIPFLYEKGYRGLRKAQTEIIKRSENFSDKVAFLSNMELELRKQGKTLDDLYRIPEEARQELVGRVIDDTMKLQNKYAGVLNKSKTGYKIGPYGSPEYIAMNLAGMFAKYPINFLNELAKRQAANGKLLTGPFMAFVLASGGTFGTYSLLTSKEQKDTMGKAKVLATAWTRALSQIKPGSVPLGLVDDVLKTLQGDVGGLKGVLAPIVPGLPAMRQGYNAFNFIGGNK